MARISAIESIGEERAALLKGMQVSTTEQLLARCATWEARREFAAASGIEEHQLVYLVSRADLERLHGVGWDYAELLAAAGVSAVAALAVSDADALLALMIAVNAERSIVRRLPTEQQLRQWIEEAKKLPVVLTYAPTQSY